MNTDDYKTPSLDELIDDCLKKKGLKFQLMASYLMDLRDIHSLTYNATMHRREIMHQHLTREASSARKKRRR